MMPSSHHYLFDAAEILNECIDLLQTTIQRDSLSSRNFEFYDLKEVLIHAESVLHEYVDAMIQKERRKMTRLSQNKQHACLNDALSDFRLVLEEQRQRNILSQKQLQLLNPQDPPTLKETNKDMYSTRSATDSLLFRLIVSLQLCLLRIDDAHLVTIGRRSSEKEAKLLEKQQQIVATTNRCCVLMAGFFLVTSAMRKQFQITQRITNLNCQKRSLVKFVALSSTALLLGRFMKSQWRRLWMTDKLRKSIFEIEDWISQWRAVQLTPSFKQRNDDADTLPGVDLFDETPRKLIEYTVRSNPKSYFWQSQGEIRFLMLKRFMDVFYASVGTAIDSGNVPESSWKLPLMTGAAASFYSITGTGASIKASHIINERSRDLIQHAWGMVSLPAIKTLMLQGSRLLKRASVADRLVIAGVPCFVLSRDPAPELAATLKRSQRRFGEVVPQLLNRMSTISETTSEASSPNFDTSQRRFAGSCGRYRQRNLILHLTGGGFFAHTIASDLPYLLDWSAATGAVVICPEYALLPENTYPVALEQTVRVYEALVHDIDMGFQVNHIAVTGESAGGNLAAALCVHIGQQQNEYDLNIQNQSCNGNDDLPIHDDVENLPLRMPDALMLSCAALNLSLDMSYSRLNEREDPVLPSGLISAISDAYAPEQFNKRDPLISPFFASIDILKKFPPTLLFAGSHDPLLDDSVVFNDRLRCCGVSSELRAAHNMPHAYWGLGTAGFPEAQQVQQECQEWLEKQFHHDDTTTAF